ncbi:hypothetical protein FZC84_21015 [Rossellomorea vietnamensis]|uniref:Pyruvate carboxyltransferase domain-containing protein n=1 Tax=Rossellomorea vietnamensis TaxID=218284 RepID=A0A5D4M1V8_9BACI|nr:hypothetical protein [Rossellomorea vietnamensis]TYR95914.1 hypothetical protein FZC84_21015 [Rossellomorea vietnamensis]
MTSILDCTLRDGGYYTDWDFEKGIVDDYLDTMSQLPMIEYIEIGYRSPAQDKYLGQYFYLPIDTVKYIREKIDHSKKLSIMINTKDCTSIEQLEYLLSDCIGYIDLVRFAVSPANFDHALNLANKTKDMGFEVALNLMYVSQINNGDIKSYIDQIVTGAPRTDYIYLVDSFGACYPEEVKKKVRIALEASNIPIGYHGHDNIQLAFANSIASEEAGAVIIDSTITGMGRGAGNLSTELFCSYISNKKDLVIDYSRLANIVERFTEIKNEYGWGTSLPYMISGLEKLPQGEIMRLLSMKRYNTNSIINLLNEKEEKILPDDEDTFKGIETLDFSNTVLIGGGKEVAHNIEGLLSFAKKTNTAFIHASLKNLDYFMKKDVTNIVCLPGDELNKLGKYYNKDIIYLISDKQPNKVDDNIIKMPNVFILTDEYLPNLNEFTFDPPLLMALKAAFKIQGSSIFLAGFDGYDQETEANKYLREENQQIIDVYNKNFEHKLISLTPTKYNIKVKSIYSLIVHGVING